MISRAYLLAGMLAATASLSTAANAAPVLWSSASGGNDHYYDYHYAYASFDSDRVAALSSTFMGMSGYLATVTSAAEDTFLQDYVNSGGGYLGGSDESQEGTWTWLDGPEAGGVFYSTSGAPLDYGYSNWNPGEPNDGFPRGPENALFDQGTVGDWNDVKNAEPLGVGYFVEYGTSAVTAAVPEPGAWALMIAGFGLVGARMRHRRRKPMLSVA